MPMPCAAILWVKTRVMVRVASERRNPIVSCNRRWSKVAFPLALLPRKRDDSLFATVASAMLVPKSATPQLGVGYFDKPILTVVDGNVLSGRADLGSKYEIGSSSL